jgi:hypothetical protein
MSSCESILESWSAALATGEPAAADVRSHLADCESCRRSTVELEEVWRRLGSLADEAPSALLRRDFEGVLAGYREGLSGRPAALDRPIHDLAASRERPATATLSRRQRTVRRRIYQLGYGLAALLAGVVLGVTLRPGPDREEVAEMRGELRALRQDVALSMMQQTSASARLQGVSDGATMSRRDPEVLAALLETLTTDPSPNVRLAAVDALAGRAGEPAVQQRLGAALFEEESPLVQIALADALLSSDGAQARRIVAPLASRAGVAREVRQYVRQRLGLRT